MPVLGGGGGVHYKINVKLLTEPCLLFQEVYSCRDSWDLNPMLIDAGPPSANFELHD